MNRSIAWTIGCALAAAVVGGCNSQPYVTPERLDRGLVLVYTGIEGRSMLNAAICDGLIDGHVPYAVERIDWTVGVPGAYLVNLRYEHRNRQTAARLARRVEAYRKRYPGRPVVLVGQSGGAAMAVWTVESLEKGQQVDGIILLAASLSPQYSLQEAAMRSRRGIANFYSAGDTVFLGMGTTVYGTMDGQHTSSAGRLGFDLPLGPTRPAWSAKLYQIPWRAEMSLAGHRGGHTGSGAAPFVRDYVAPLIRAPHWDHAFVDGVSGGDEAQALSAERPPAAFHRY